MEKDNDSFSMIDKEEPKIVYSKSNVYFQDTAGSLTITDKTHDYCIGWTPETNDTFIQVDYNEKNQSSTKFSFSENYDGFSLQIQTLHSLISTPGQILFQHQNGQKFGPLFHDDFHDFIQKLSTLTQIHPCSSQLYLVGQDPFDPVNTLKEARWSLLEKLSKVTQFSRKAAASLFQPDPPAVQSTMDDYDSARLFLAKWAAGLAEESERNSYKKQIGVWGHEESSCGLFEILNDDTFAHTRTLAVDLKEWSNWFDDQGRLKVEISLVRQRIFSGGVRPEIRKEAWLFLTSVYPWKSTALERQDLDKKRKIEYEALKKQWSENQDIASFKDQRHRIEKDVHRTDRTIELYAHEENLEVLRSILCTYNTYHPTLGYVQGMSDLLSPLYAITQQEHLAFWSFVGVMERMKSNFYKDQSGMHHQLVLMDHLLQFMDYSLYKHLQRTDNGNFFFCFRWLLVLYKREFVWNDMLILWEVLWTDHLTNKFHLFIALAILDKHRDYIMTYLKNFDEVLKYINDLSMDMNLQDILERAEILFYQFKQRMEAVDTKREQWQEILKTLDGEEKEKIKSDLNKLPNQDEALRDLL